MTSAPTYEELLQTVKKLEDEALKVKEATKSLRLTGQYINVAIDSLSANMAILDENGVILETNRSWQRFGLENKIETSADTVGLNYLEICDSAQGDPEEVEKAHEVADGIKRVIAGDKMKEHRDENEKRLESGWAGPGIEVWPEEDDYVMWRSMRKNARRHLECSIPALAASPFCGKGYHNG